MAILRYRDKDGTIKDIPTIRGVPGYTPVKGKDYFTPEDIAEIVAQATEEVQVGIAPVLLSGATWYKTELSRSTFTNIRIVDRYEPTGAETEHWNADVEDMGKIRCYVDGTTLIIAGNGSGRIMANANSATIFGAISQTESWSNLTAMEGLELLDTRNTTTMKNAFLLCDMLADGIGAIGKCNVSKCLSFQQCFYSTNVSELDLSSWDVSAAVDAARKELDETGSTKIFHNFLGSCNGLARVTLNKSFDITLFGLPYPYYTDDSGNKIYGNWLDEETGIVYAYTTPTAEMPNPCVEGRNITYVAVWEEASYGDV